MQEITTLMMVTYNRLDLTKKTINHLKESIKIPCNLVVVDNKSEDETFAYLCDLGTELPKPFEKIDIISLGENRGIAKGRNIALQRADELKTKWYCTIDNDVMMPEGWLSECIDILKRNREYGIIGVNMENKQYPIITKNGCSFQNKPQGNLGTACMVFKKQVHQMIGFFNTEYGQYGEEDADFGMRTRVAGFKLGYICKMGTHLGADESEVSEYRKFKTKQHADNLALFQQNCALYAQRRKPLYISYVE